MQAMTMFSLLKLLTDAQIEFVLVGGLAVALHGYQRQTMDVDIVIAMSPENIERLIACGKANDLRPGIPVPIESLADPEMLEQLRIEKGMLAFSLRSPEAMATVVDILIKPVITYENLYRDAVVVHVGGLSVRIASVAHLIAMKTGTGRSKDAIDIDELTKLQGMADS